MELTLVSGKVFPWVSQQYFEYMMHMYKDIQGQFDCLFKSSPPI